MNIHSAGKPTIFLRSDNSSEGDFFFLILPHEISTLSSKNRPSYGVINVGSEGVRLKFLKILDVFIQLSYIRPYLLILPEPFLFEGLGRYLCIYFNLDEIKLAEEEL